MTNNTSALDTTSNRTIPQLDCSDPLYMQHSDTPGFKFNNHRKKGFNNQSSAYNDTTRDEFINRVGGVVPIIQGLSNAQYLEVMQMIDNARMTDKAKEQANTQVDSTNMAGPLQWQGEGDW